MPSDSNDINENNVRPPGHQVGDEEAGRVIPVSFKRELSLTASGKRMTAGV